MPTFLELLISPGTATLLRRLQEGLPKSDVAGLPLRSRYLTQRLERAGLLEKWKNSAGVICLRLTPGVARQVPALPKGPVVREITSHQLKLLGLPDIPAFEIRSQAAKGKGRPQGARTGKRAVYLRKPPPLDFEASRDIDETVLALLLLDGRSARKLVEAKLKTHPQWDWSGLRKRLHDEELETRAAHFGLRKLIGLRARASSDGPKAPRSDAFRRARTEPKAKRLSRAKE